MILSGMTKMLAAYWMVGEDNYKQDQEPGKPIIGGILFLNHHAADQQ